MNLNRIKNNVVIDQQGCWIWSGSTNSAGYGQLMENNKYWTTHRYAYTCVNGAIPDNLIVRHICHNVRCCNPEHLIIGCHSDNYNDSIDKHNEANIRKRKTWIIDGVVFPTIREAALVTGIHQVTILKYIENGIFNIDKYRAGCKIANTIPKV